LLTPLLLPACGLGVSLLVTLKTLFDLEAMVEQLGLKQLGVDNNATFDSLDLEGLGRKAKDKRSPSLSFSLVTLCLRFWVVELLYVVYCYPWDSPLCPFTDLLDKGAIVYILLAVNSQAE
jgi:hypothetical protein